MIQYGSVCSGIESASVAWGPLGMSPVWFSEIEPFPSAVLAHHWPNVINLGDMTLIKDMLDLGIVKAPEILVGGTPCQAFSVAGARKGLEDERGQLTIEYVRLLDVLDKQRRKAGKREAVCVWENVPGVLSSKDNAFGCFLAALVGEDRELQPAGKKWSNAGCVFGPQRTVAWRTLDAQYFGVAQRRKRVFVVASARKKFNPRKVLFESKGVRRDTPPSREAREGTSIDITSGFSSGSDPSLTATLCAQDNIKWGSNQWVDNGKAIIFPIQNATRGASQNGLGIGTPSDPQYTLDTASQHAVGYDYIVRRLMPIEAERLQGFSDNHTRIPFRNKPIDNCSDNHRYKAIGNSKAVPVMRWIGQRLLRELLNDRVAHPSTTSRVPETMRDAPAYS